MTAASHQYLVLAIPADNHIYLGYFSKYKKTSKNLRKYEKVC
jgi:hypothetical protein